MMKNVSLRIFPEKPAFFSGNIEKMVRPIKIMLTFFLIQGK